MADMVGEGVSAEVLVVTAQHALRKQGMNTDDVNLAVRLMRDRGDWDEVVKGLDEAGVHIDYATLAGWRTAIEARAAERRDRPVIPVPDPLPVGPPAPHLMTRDQLIAEVQRYRAARAKGGI